LFARSRVEREIDDELVRNGNAEGRQSSGRHVSECLPDALLRLREPDVIKGEAAGADAALGLDSIWADLRVRAASVGKVAGLCVDLILILALGHRSLHGDLQRSVKPICLIRCRIRTPNKS